LTADYNTKLILFNLELEIVQEISMDGVFTKQFVALSDSVFFCCVQCPICESKDIGMMNHLFKIDLSSKDTFTHYPIKVIGCGTIALSENKKYIFYADAKAKGIVINSCLNLDSSKIIIHSYPTLLGSSKYCTFEKN